ALCLQVGWAQHPTPVILISVDTLRADHLSCYDTGRRPTPHIDALARHGSLFSQVGSPFPLTLPSHASMFTSTYPFTNGVEDNGVPLKSGAVTIATVLKSAGYRTGAFVASFVLDRRFGLNRGFDVYDGPIDVHSTTTALVERKRPGAKVADAALHWLDANSSVPFFLFLHLYDLHLPYDLPQDPSLRHGETGYSAELAYEDRVLGDFLAALNRRKLLDKALIVFTSDHGEGLGEHGESTHGYFIYQSTVRVPLIIHWPPEFSRAMSERIDEPASLLDVAPTILDVIGIPRPPSMRGRSLISGSNDREIYSESLYARNHFGCAPLRSLRVGRYKYIESPKPELYDLVSDPNEARNLYDQHRSRATALAEQVSAIRRTSAAVGSSTSASPTSDTIATLRSLGYLSGSTKSIRTDPKVDPKDRIAEFEEYLRALDLSSAGKLSESDALLQGLRDKLPDVADIRLSLGLNKQRAGDFAGAAREFEAAIQQDPSEAEPHFELGFCQFRLGQLDDAIQQFKAALALEPWYTRPDEALAEIYTRKNDYPQARAYLNQLLSIDPNSYTAHYNLGIFAALEQNWADAEHHMQLALRADPGSAEAHDALGKIFQAEGRSDKAAQEFRAAQDAGRSAASRQKP
ncbi:MAG: sulfatase-like hydrolase/transferase, partial [Acidobacteriaceae bacterium]|nr:sulfatase-like hydrolase/transferase [Acidobacteriaceae bacterium]